MQHLTGHHQFSEDSAEPATFTHIEPKNMLTKNVGAMEHGILMRGTKNGAITVAVVVWRECAVFNTFTLLPMLFLSCFCCRRCLYFLLTSNCKCIASPCTRTYLLPF
ncbi:hypothetical protein CDAR_97551 [Caerostris darwini]|uniref:Uncharacterized protein n=1 Tax=Caerostris darwini TaxID=1538125 RepID=A0AAV4SQB1_9ARAC|nr:hypothetical protein CDAR_97551 [Caerostris darwini]